ncbi:Cys-tRNA(Pro) deacylase [Ectobacillus polymachus]|uniref:Cys-tRNA(Pro) deacylase n=1 Tax=Ectobacillus polymachus TaxID=1508806 RepID=UPI003A8BA616
MANKTIASRILDRNHISYSLHEYEWDEEHLNAEHVADQVELSLEQVFKTLVLRGDKTGIIMACIPSHTELRLKALAAVSGNKKVEMVHVKEIQALTGYIRGGVSPLGVKKNYPLYLDKTSENLNPISISAGKRGLQIFISGADLMKVTNAIPCSITEKDAE